MADNSKERDEVLLKMLKTPPKAKTEPPLPVKKPTKVTPEGTTKKRG